MLGIVSVRGARSAVLLPELWLQLSLALHSHRAVSWGPKRSRSYCQDCLNTRIKLWKLAISQSVQSHWRDQRSLRSLWTWKTLKDTRKPRKGWQQNLDSTLEERPWVKIEDVYWTGELLLCVCIRTTSLMVLRHFSFVSLKYQSQTIWGLVSGIDSLGSFASWKVHFVLRNSTAPKAGRAWTVFTVKMNP